ncbi:MAG TPA: hypothetical protein DHW39_10280 [Erysipelotrichaceae bacterium]|nr:hypothetical protein [Erysipelotrichaceae bacterium]
MEENMNLKGNERIEEAAEYFRETGNMNRLLETIRDRMRHDGHFLIPVQVEGEDVSLRTIMKEDGTMWLCAFTSDIEAKKGPESRLVSVFMENCLKDCLESNAEGIIINPWNQSIHLSKALINAVLAADEGEEYAVPDTWTEEMLNDSAFLKKCLGICKKYRTQLNYIRLMRILSQCTVWVPCNAVMEKEDEEAFARMIEEAMEKGDPDSMIGREFVTKGITRMIPDILQSGENFYFPAFTSAEEMGEYGEHFSKVAHDFMNVLNIAENNEQKPCAIVINAFSEPFEIPKELFDVIRSLAAN